MRATYIGPPLSEIISHAAPTVCMNAPMSETTFATSRLRKTVDLRGRQRLVDSGKIVLLKRFRSVRAIPDPGKPLDWSSSLEKGALLEFVERLAQLLLGIHHDRSVP